MCTFILWSHVDYYGGSVALGVAPRGSISCYIDQTHVHGLGRPLIPTLGLTARCSTRGLR
jgi:hypothetical protein